MGSLPACFYCTLSFFDYNMILCQDLVQVKMRNFSHFNLPKVQLSCGFFNILVRIRPVTHSRNGYESVWYCRKLPRIFCGNSPWLAPWSADSHLAHIDANCSFRNNFTSFMQFCSDFRSAVVLLRIIINILYFGFLILACTIYILISLSARIAG